MKAKIALVFTCSILLIGNCLFAQNISEKLSWSKSMERIKYPYRFEQLSENELYALYFGEKEIVVNKINANNDVLGSVTLNTGEIKKYCESALVDHIYVNGYIYAYARVFDKTRRKFDVYKWRLNLKSLSVDIVKEKVFEFDFLENGRASRLHLAVSEDKKSFFLGYHNLEEKAEKESEFRFNFTGTIYSAEGEEIRQIHHVFTDKEDYFLVKRTYTQLSNDGNVLLRHYKKKEIFYSHKGSDAFEKIDLIEELREEDPNINVLNNLVAISAPLENMYALSYSSRRDRRFVSGIAIIKFDDRGNFKILKQFKPPEELTQILGKSKYMEPAEPVRDYEKDKYELFIWQLFDFKKIGNYYYLVTEYNYNYYTYFKHTISNLYRLGDLVVYRFSNDFDEYEWFHLPKYYYSDCEFDHCGKLISKGERRSYSLVVKGETLNFFYWNNVNNEVLMTNAEMKKREVHHVPTSYRKDIGLYHAKLSAATNGFKIERLGEYYYMEFPVLPNVCAEQENKVLFYSMDKRLNKLVTYKLEQ